MNRDLGGSRTLRQGRLASEAGRGFAQVATMRKARKTAATDSSHLNKSKSTRATTYDLRTPSSVKSPTQGTCFR